MQNLQIMKILCLKVLLPKMPPQSYSTVHQVSFICRLDVVVIMYMLTVLLIMIIGITIVISTSGTGVLAFLALFEY